MNKSTFLLLACVAMFAACTPQVANQPNADPDSSSEVKNLAASKSEKEKADQEPVVKSPSEQLAKLNRDFAKANDQWMEAGREIEDQTASQAHFEARPCTKYAEDLAALAKKFPKTPAAIDAWPLVLKWGLGNCKFEAADVLLNAAKTETDATKSIADFEYIMNYSLGGPQKEAMELMLEFAKEEADPKTRFELLKKLATSRRGLHIAREGYLLMPGNEEVRVKAMEELKLILQTDVKSEQAVEILELMHSFGAAETKEFAFNQLMEHHATHFTTMEIVQSLVDTADNESKLKSLLDHPNPIVQANAAVSLAAFFARKQRRARYHEAQPPRPPGQRIVGGEERSAYLKTGVAAEDLAALEEQLTRHLKDRHELQDHENLISSVQSTLFVMQNLAIGKIAPDIVGNDLDGVEFKLSDYRGKVVLLDFWVNW